MQKCFGLKRFSEDLDFNYLNIDIDKLIEYLIKNLEEKVEIEDKHKTNFGISFVLRIEGILFDSTPMSRCKISLDFRENYTYLDLKKLIIRPIYHDLNNYFLLSISEKEILAEKVRTIMTRYKARDIFDLTELLYKNIEIDYELINKKLITYNLKFDLNLFLDKVLEKRTIYENEISSLTDIYSSFDKSFEVIKSSFKK